MAAGQPLTDQDRAPWLEALAELIEASLAEGEGLVLACSALKRSYRRRLGVDHPEVRLVYLKITPELAQKRLEARAGHYMPAQLVPSQFEVLEEPVEAIDVSAARTPSSIVEAILEALGPDTAPSALSGET